MRRPLALLPVALLAVLAGRVEAAPNHAATVNSGDRVLGTIDSPADRDLFRISAPDGAYLEVVVKSSKKSLLLPNLGLLDPAGNAVDMGPYVTGLTSTTVSIPVFGIHETGTWTVTVSGVQGTTGAYQLVIKTVAEAKIRASVTVPSGGTFRHRFVGVDGALVSYTLVETSGPGLADAGLCCPSDQGIPGSEGVRSGTRLKGKKILLDRGGGLYAVEMTGSAGGPTTVDASVVVRFPKVKTARHLLAEEPRPAVMSPWSGRDGTAFVLTGTGFGQGARVVFGDTEEATEVEWISSTEIRGKAPEGEISRNGGTVPVSVLNTDGQYGSTATGFTFIGVPGPSSFTPKLSPLQGGVAVSIAGIRFRAGYTVEVGGIPSPSVTLLSPSHLSFLTPAASAGTYDVVVKDEYGRAAAALPGLWYSAAPDVTFADPTELSSLGGVTIHLAGTGFVPGVRVFVGGTEAVLQSLVPPTNLSFLCPPARSGPVEVEVRDPLGRSYFGDLLTMARALQDVSNTALPSPPNGAEFWGDIVNLGDTGGDGLPEILVTSVTRWVNPSNGQFMPGSFLFGNLGDGAFSNETGTALPNFSLPEDDGQGDAAVMGDLDGDGLADAALVRAVPLTTGYTSFDYNGFDAFYDIDYPSVVDSLTATATRILLNNGSGSLKDRTDECAPAQESTPALGAGERWQGQAATLGDLDGDGAADLFLVSRDRVDIGTVTDIRYTYKKVYYYYYYYYYNVKDKAIITQEAAPTGALRVLANDGSGAFTHDPGADPAPVLSGNGTVLDDFRGTAVAAGDLDGDGTDDVVVVGTEKTRADDGAGGTADAPALRVILNDGTGTFSFSPGSIPAALGSTSPESNEWWQGNALALGDFDADGDLDIALGRSTVRTWIQTGFTEKKVIPALRIFRNDGFGTFTEDTASFLAPELTTQATAQTMLGVSSMASVDFDGDGDTDLVVTGRVTTPSTPTIPGTGRMCTRIFLNDGEAGLTDATAVWLAPWDFQPADGLAVGDLDGDGHQDVVLVLHGSAGEGKRSLRVLMNR